MYRTLVRHLFMLALAAFAVSQAAAQTHPFSVHDMVAMDRISEPAVSPDGKQIVFVLRKTDLEANRGRTDLWLTDIDGKNLRQLTTDPALAPLRDHPSFKTLLQRYSSSQPNGTTAGP